MRGTGSSRRGRRAGAACLAAALALAGPAGAQLVFEHVVIDAANPANPHCKALGDVDGDGRIDAVVASSSGAGMYWYEYPAWTKHAIRVAGSWTTDMQLGDVDGDGDLDVVIPDASGLSWFENPRPGGDPRSATWIEHPIGAAGANSHDVEVGDLEPDGDLDVVTRGKGGGGTYFWRQTAPDAWRRITVSSGSGEGTALGDLDSDGDLDVAQNGFWVEQVGPTSWTEHPIDAAWPADVGVAIADIDGNGSNDVVLAPSESAGRLSWYEAIDPVAGPWIEHPIDPAVAYFHTFEVADMDRDGDLDLVTAEMHQSSDPDEVSVYFNDAGTSWSRQVVATSGSHNVRVGDVGGDGDLDIFGANWNDGAPNSAVVEMWENRTAPLPLGLWRRHVIETSLPWNAVFVYGRDLDGDGLPDLATGGWWYPNPGSLGGVWSRRTIGAPLHNVAAVHDFDNDGDQDILGTDGQVGGEDFSWARNDGAGGFTSFDIVNPATGGDFLQGVAVDQVAAGGQEEVVISWHNGGSGTAMLEVPDDPTAAAWPLTPLSATTNQEAVPTGDLDGDGDVDVHLGSSWLRQESDGTFSTRPGVALGGGGVPDRVALADLDGDGDLDVVIGVEFGSALVWGENDGAGGGWSEHPIASDFDYFSVGVGDVDGDGDPDVVGGAHLGGGEVTLYENDGTGLGWTAHVVDPGDSTAIDHHDGTQLVDMDLDRDLDVISIGWSKRSLVIYENLAIDGGAGGGGDTTPPAIAAVHAPGPATRVVVELSEAVSASTAGEASNYSVSDGIAVTDAAPAANGRAVALTTSALAPGVIYTLTVDGVEDLAGNPIAPGSTAEFERAAGDPEPGLVAYWPFDLGAGTVAIDRSGNGHDGFLTNGPQWTAEPALAFDGADDYVDAGAFGVAGEALTLAAWIYPEDLANCGSRDCRVISKATGTAEGDHVFMVSTIASGGATRLRFRLETDGATSTLIAASGDLEEDRWLHVAAVYDGATMALFLDGAQVGSAAQSGALTGDPAVPVWIGGNPPDPAGRPWRGRIDEVRVYDRALSPAELLALPPPSAAAIFADGFESGDLARWSGERVGSVEVLSAARRIGTRGARVGAGTGCASPDAVAIAPPPATVQGVHEACRELSAEGVEVVAPGATLRAGERVVLGAGFSAAADLAVEIDPALTPFAWIRDGSPEAESAYTAEFHLRLDGLALGGGDRLEHLVGRSAAGEAAFRLVLQSDGSGGHEARLEARRDDGTFAATPAGQEIALPPGWHRLRLEWRAGAGDGTLSLSLDGAPAGGLSGLQNGGQRVDAVDWGTVAGSLGATSGHLDLDAFSSWS